MVQGGERIQRVPFKSNRGEEAIRSSLAAGMEGGGGGRGIRGGHTVGYVFDEELDAAIDLEIEKATAPRGVFIDRESSSG